jgi:peptide/nickel transport system substrate-binding protein
VTQLSGPLMPGIKPAQGFVSPGNGTWYSEPFKKYGRDLAKVNQLMTCDGWTKGSDGIWAKAGTRAVVELNTASGNRRRELTEQILQSQWKEAGFEATVNNPTSAVLLGEWVPKGVFQIALFGFAPGSADPNHCRNFCTKFIPTEANGYQGGDVSHLSSPAVDDAWQAVTSELDQAKRVELARRGQQALADNLPGLPISPVVDIVVYNSAKIGGLKLNPVGAFSNLSEWYCRARCGS